MIFLATVAFAVTCAAPASELEVAVQPAEANAEAVPEAAAEAADLQGSDSLLEKFYKKQLKHGGFGYGLGAPYGGFGYPGFGYPGGFGGFGSPLYGGYPSIGYGGLGGYGLGGYGLGGYGLGGFGGYPLGFGF